MTAADSIFSPPLAHLEQELVSIRTGRAHPAVVEHLMVECYGSHSPLPHVAAISVPEPQTLLIQPWDVSIIKDIEKALRQSSLGINPVVDGKLIRLPFPPMTNERRELLEKVVREKTEATRIAIRKVREERIKELRAAETSGQQSEDATEISLKKFQVEVEAANARAERLAEDKLTELRTI